MAANLAKSGEWFQEQKPSSSEVSTPRVSNISCLSHGEAAAPETPTSRIRSEDTEFVKLAKSGGQKDLLSPEPAAQPSPSPTKYDKKGGEWFNQDRANNNDPPATPRSKVKESDTEFLIIAKEGGRKDLLAIKEHKRSEKPAEFEKKGGDWYTHEARNGVDGPPATPRTRAKKNDTAFIQLAKDGGRKDLLEINEHKPTKAAATYKKKGGDWYYQDGVDIKESLQKRDQATPDSARVHRNYKKLQARKTDTDYIKTAKKGGHSDLLKTPRNTASKAPVNYKRSDWFYLEDNGNSKKTQDRPQTARKSRTMTSTVLPSDSVDGSSRPRTAYKPRVDPIWLGGSGPQVQPSPRKHINRDTGLSPYALHN